MRALRKRQACGQACANRFLRYVRWEALPGFSRRDPFGTIPKSSSRFPEIRKAGSRTSGLCFFLWHQRKKRANKPSQTGPNLFACIARTFFLCWFELEKEIRLNYDEEFKRLVDIVKRLRKDCPWDREQTHESLRHSFIEELYEAVEAIDNQQWHELRNELGDVLLHVALQSAIAEEQNEFTLAEVIHHINEKLIRRHPHVFGEKSTVDLSTQKRNWEKIKLSEGRQSVVEGVPKEMPALLRALRLQEKAAKVGFDWNNSEEVWQKVTEEIHELQEAVQHQSKERVAEEFGDVLFSLVNYSRFLHVNPEESLRETAGKFVKRFNYVEERLRDQGKDIYRTTLEEMDGLWNEAKEKKHL
jgi:tetrapyrrole methylase family protein / MazG family protein